MSSILSLPKAQRPETLPRAAFTAPASERETIDEITTYGTALTIHYNGHMHWVIHYNGHMHWVATACLDGKVYLFDSLAGDILPSSLEEQIAAIYGDVATMVLLKIRRKKNNSNFVSPKN